MFCPKCNAEYERGVRRCPECGVLLLLRFPTFNPRVVDSETGLVVLRTYNNQFDADLARTTLEAAGIESIFRSDDCGGRGPNLSFIRGIDILVRSADAEDARAILDLDATGSEPI
jgi:hypothetical protein